MASRLLYIVALLHSVRVEVSAQGYLWKDSYRLDFSYDPSADNG